MTEPNVAARDLTPTATLTLERARALDEADPLAAFRDRFSIPEPRLIYLDGNSLGRPALAALERLAALGRTWASELVAGWDEWLDLPLEAGDELASAALGARPGEVAITDSTTVNLYRLASAALDARPDRRAIAISREEFPTDRYVVEGLAAARGLEIRWIEADAVEGPNVADVGTVIDDQLALVVIAHANYRSAALADVSAITATARSGGAFVLWDLSHSVGAVPGQLGEAGVDLAVGCTYKYLNGGPGSPAFLYVRRELQDELRPPIQGWFAQRDQFAMGPRFERQPGIAGWLVGTPVVAGLVTVRAGIELVAEAGIDRIRDKGLVLTSYAVDLIDGLLVPLDSALGSPREAMRRGSHVSVRHAEARRLAAALTDRGVIVDYRAPNTIRFGLSPLTTSFEDVHRGINALREVLA